MIYAIVWWVLLMLIGAAALPVTLRFLRVLPERGYAFSKPLGLLLWVYPFWLLASFGFIQNTFGALAFLLIALALASWFLFRGRGGDSVGSWLRANWRYALVVEIIFTVAYFGFAFFRAYTPEINGTEKPMEYMFLNSILSSSAFPPRDGWLAGYSISYYYFGYVIVAALAKLGSIPSGYAFNLGLTTIYALTAAGAFGVVFNLVSRALGLRLADSSGRADARSSADEPESATAALSPERAARRSLAPYGFGLLAIVLMLVVGNLEGAFEAGYNAGIGSPAQYASLNLHGLETVQPSGTFVPQDNWWWWRASRVLNDKNPVDGSQVEVIDEFPAFSFLLGDLHPHVLSLPFCLLALAVAFSLLLKPFTPVSSWATLARTLLTPRMALIVLLVGALGMLNTWDIVTYGIIIAAGFGLALYRATARLDRWFVGSVAAFLVTVYLGSFLLFLPFYLTFSSQARGIMPEIFNKTPLASYLIMYGLFLFVIAAFVLSLVGARRALPFLAGAVGGALVGWLISLAPLQNAVPWKSEMLVGGLSLVGLAAAVIGVLVVGRDQRLKELGDWAAVLLLLPLALAAVGLGVLVARPELQTLVGSALRIAPGSSILIAILSAFFGALAANPGVLILLTLLIPATIVAGRSVLHSASPLAASGLDATTILFVLVMALVGLALTLGVEFLYVRDIFETRMNTVFKLYYQSWLLFAMAASFGVFYLWRTTRGVTRGALATGFGVLIALSLIYPLLAVPSRTNSFKSNAAAGVPTLDGWAWVARQYPDDYAAIEWLRQNAPRDSIILEAPGPQYSFYNRVSVATGLPTVLGWAGHEAQWRANFDQGAPREQDAAEIYQSRDLNKIRELLNKYNVDYVIVGGLEREKYNLNQALVNKFNKLGPLVFEKGSMRIYQVGNVGVSFATP